MLPAHLHNLRDLRIVREVVSVAYAMRWLGSAADPPGDLALLCRALRLSAGPPFRRRLLDGLQRSLGRIGLVGPDALPVAENPVWREHVASEEGRRTRARFRAFGEEAMVRLRFPGKDGEPDEGGRQGDLIILKPAAPAGDERGVLLVKYTEAIRRFAAIFDLGRIAADYRVVLEPSSWGYEDPSLLMYLGRDLDVVVQCPWARDRRFVRSLNANLVACHLGAGDWVDPGTFRPRADDYPRSGRSIDIAMISSWHPLKRHADLFRAIPGIERRLGRRVRVHLVGYDAGRDRSWVVGLGERAGVKDRLTIEEDVDHHEVADVLRQSRCYVLLSRAEGANKALFEAMAADTPVVYYARHRGVPVDRLTSACGVGFRHNGELAAAVAEVVRRCDEFHPRAWIAEHSGWSRSTATLGGLLEELAARAGERWTIPIEPKMNAPNLHYVREPAWDREEAYGRLATCLVEDPGT